MIVCKGAEKINLLDKVNLLTLALEEPRTHLLVQNLRDAVMIFNGAEEVVLVNRAMTVLLNKGEATLLRRPLDEALGDSPFASLVKTMTAGTAAGRTVFDLEVDDSQYMLGITPFLGENGDELGHILTISDISEVRRLAMEKSQFLLMMIHELRSPLGAIKGVLDVIADRSLGADVSSYLPLLERAERRLGGLIDLVGVLLNLSQIELEGPGGVAVSLIDPSPVVEEVAEMFRPQMEAAGIALELLLDQGVRAPIHPGDLKIILTNLIGNAVKYNRPGGRVTVRVDGEGNMVRFQVEDTGLGIKTENVPLVFEDFFREKRPETREIAGNGLGLAIVKRLVQRYSGQVGCVSEEGKGTIFTVRLSAGPPQPADPGMAAPAQAKVC